MLATIMTANSITSSSSTHVAGSSIRRRRGSATTAPSTPPLPRRSSSDPKPSADPDRCAAAANATVSMLSPNAARPLRSEAVMRASATPIQMSRIGTTYRNTPSRTASALSKTRPTTPARSPSSPNAQITASANSDSATISRDRPLRALRTTRENPLRPSCADDDLDASFEPLAPAVPRALTSARVPRQGWTIGDPADYASSVPASKERCSAAAFRR